MTETSPNPVGVALWLGGAEGIGIFQRRKKLTVMSVKALGYDVVVACQMSPAVAAGVHLRTVGYTMALFSDKAIFDSAMSVVEVLPFLLGCWQLRVCVCVQN
jgi:hypothetical protein